MGILDAPSSRRRQQQPTPRTPIQVFRVDTTPAAAPFQVIVNGFPNSDVGASTNHAIHIGFNAGRHAQADYLAGTNSVYIGLEDNYYDPADGTTGPEFYTGYITPDGTTVPIATLRPFYWRILSNDNTANKSVVINLDMGSGSNGHFSVFKGISTGRPVFSLTATAGSVTVPLTVEGLLNVANYTSAASLYLDGKTSAGMTWLQNGVAAYTFLASNPSNFSVLDKAGTPVLSFAYAAAAIDSVTSIKTSASVTGRLVVNGAAALATSAPEGFLHIPYMAGAPTAPPNNHGGTPIVYDTTSNKLWIYNGTWKAATFA